MKRKYLWLMVLVLGLALFTVGCGGETEKTTWEMIQDKGVMVVGLDDSFAPMGYHDEKTNDLIGFDIDMGDELGKRLGVEIQWQPTEWDGVMGALNSKRFDVIISGMSVTEERKKVIDFSQSYVNSDIVMVVKKDNTDITSVKDLKGKVVATQTGSSGETACNKKGLEDVKLYDQYPEAFQDLAIGRIDVVIVDYVTAVHYITKKFDSYKVAGDRLAKEPYAIGIRKADMDLKDAIDVALTEMQKDGILTEISKKWLGKDFTPKAE